LILALLNDRPVNAVAVDPERSVKKFPVVGFLKALIFNEVLELANILHNILASVNSSNWVGGARLFKISLMIYVFGFPSDRSIENANVLDLTNTSTYLLVAASVLLVGSEMPLI